MCLLSYVLFKGTSLGFKSSCYALLAAIALLSSTCQGHATRISPRAGAGRSGRGSSALPLVPFKMLFIGWYVLLCINPYSQVAFINIYIYICIYIYIIYGILSCKQKQIILWLMTSITSLAFLMKWHEIGALLHENGLKCGEFNVLCPRCCSFPNPFQDLSSKSRDFGSFWKSEQNYNTPTRWKHGFRNVQDYDSDNEMYTLRGWWLLFFHGDILQKHSEHVWTEQNCVASQIDFPNLKTCDPRLHATATPATRFRACGASNFQRKSRTGMLVLGTSPLDPLHGGFFAQTRCHGELTESTSNIKHQTDRCIKPWSSQTIQVSNIITHQYTSININKHQEMSNKHRLTSSKHQPTSININ